jgi:hypothetical protein
LTLCAAATRRPSSRSPSAIDASSTALLSDARLGRRMPRTSRVSSGSAPPRRTDQCRRFGQPPRAANPACRWGRPRSQQSRRWAMQRWFSRRPPGLHPTTDMVGTEADSHETGFYLAAWSAFNSARTGGRAGSRFLRSTTSTPIAAAAAQANAAQKVGAIAATKASRAD